MSLFGCVSGISVTSSMVSVGSSICSSGALTTLDVFRPGLLVAGAGLLVESGISLSFCSCDTFLGRPRALGFAASSLAGGLASVGASSISTSFAPRVLRPLGTSKGLGLFDFSINAFRAVSFSTATATRWLARRVLAEVFGAGLVTLLAPGRPLPFFGGIAEDPGR